MKTNVDAIKKNIENNKQILTNTTNIPKKDEDKTDADISSIIAKYIHLKHEPNSNLQNNNNIQKSDEKENETDKGRDEVKEIHKKIEDRDRELEDILPADERRDTRSRSSLSSSPYSDTSCMFLPFSPFVISY